MKENILYTFRRCPFAMRARWALLMTKRVVVWREVLLSQKPRELLSISPKGTVPVLLTSSGEVIDESVEIMYWALKENDKLNILCKNDLQAENDLKYIIKKNDCVYKYHLDRYKYADRFIKSEWEYHKNAAREILLEWENRLCSQNNNETRWLLQNRETLADWAIWPFVRQYRIVDPNSFDQDHGLQSLREWLMMYSNNSKFKVLMQKSKQWFPNNSKKYFPPEHLSK